MNFSLFSDRPSAPRNLHVTEVYADYICVTFDEPEDDGGEPITSYTVSRKNVDKQSWIQVY